MIIDSIENLSKYAQIPSQIADFLSNLDVDTKIGRYELGNGNYVNVETYHTKSINEAKFESHKDYIDIQMLLSGSERICFHNLEGLTELTPYSKEKDITFYSDKIDGDYVTLNGKNFVLIYPHEAHAPQCAISESGIEVKKVVAKLKI